MKAVGEVVALILILFATLEVMFGFLVWFWHWQVRLKRVEVIAIERANVAMASIIMIDTSGIMVQVNKDVARMFGYDPHDVLGQNVNMLMTDMDKYEHDNYIARYVRTGEPRIIGKGRLVYGKKKDGTPFPVELTVSEVKGADGLTNYFFGHLRDVTQEQWAQAVGVRRN